MPENNQANVTRINPEIVSDTLTDLGNAERFAKHHGHRVRYSYQYAGWLASDGKRWKQDESGKAETHAQVTVRTIYREAASEPDSAKRRELVNHAKRSEGAGKIAAMLELARPMLSIQLEKMDSNPYLLNLNNGTFDLKEMIFREHRSEDFITSLAPVDYIPEAECPVWIDAMCLWMVGDEERIKYIQRLAGASLSGLVREHGFYVFYGDGANGKTTYQKGISGVLGDYGDTIAPETLLATRTSANQARDDLAKLRGKRLVCASEPPKGAKLAEGLVKLATGGDPITTRRLYGRPFTFTPEFKLILSTNHKPIITGTDHAIWRRTNLIGWDHTIPDEEQDKNIDEKIKAERSGILNWMLEGFEEWIEHGLGQPEAVKAATAEYRAESDTILAFIADCCTHEPTDEIQAQVIFNAYRQWCEDTGERAVSMRAFGTRIKELGYTVEDRRRKKFYLKIAVIEREV